jgi:flagellar basal-body rod protein FlgF
MDTTANTVGMSVSALQQQFEAISHNLANVDTNGFKRRVNGFTQALQDQMKGPSVTRELQSELKAKTSIDYSQGILKATGRPLDVALEGEGFFAVETATGPLYTRNGTFHTNPQGQLVDVNGRLVSGVGGPITLPNNQAILDVAISRDGTVRAGGEDLGQLRVVTFDDVGRLLPAGESCFHAPEDLPPTESTATVHQGYKEGSNVSMVEELVNMISVTRLYEANIKSIKTNDQRMQYLLETAR